MRNFLFGLSKIKCFSVLQVSHFVSKESDDQSTLSEVMIIMLVWFSCLLFSGGLFLIYMMLLHAGG